ncbi:MAG TPA: hypothetical protein VJH23_00010 [archaeon]|nr:hypothetical protein [archaeon]
MNLFESALFRLAMRGSITLGQAKVVNAIYKNRACSLHGLRMETGLEKDELSYSVAALKERGILVEIHGFYLCPNIEEKILELIDSGTRAEEKEVLVARA